MRYREFALCSQRWQRRCQRFVLRAKEYVSAEACRNRWMQAQAAAVPAISCPTTSPEKRPKHGDVSLEEAHQHACVIACRVSQLGTCGLELMPGPILTSESPCIPKGVLAITSSIHKHHSILDGQHSRSEPTAQAKIEGLCNTKMR